MKKTQEKLCKNVLLGLHLNTGQGFCSQKKSHTVSSKKNFEKLLENLFYVVKKSPEKSLSW